VQLGNVLLTPAFITVICMLWIGWQALFGGLLLSAVVVSLYLHKVKTKMLGRLSHGTTIQPAVTSDFPHIDSAWLQQQTTLLESLGFVHLADYSPNIESTQSFGRCFAHPQHCCFAEIGQLRAGKNHATITHAVIASVFDQDWKLAHINRSTRSTDSISYMWRHPKGIRVFAPTTTLDILLQRHLEFRQKMLLDLGLTVSTDISWCTYLDLEDQSAKYRHATIKRKPLLIAMLEATWFELNPKSEWLGDYPRLAARRSRDR